MAVEHPKLKPFWQLSANYELDRDSWDLLGLPIKHRHAFIEDILPQSDEQTNLLNTLNDVIRSDRGAFIFVTGGKDTGKTFIGSAFVNSVGRWCGCYDRNTGKQTDWMPRFVSMGDLIDRLTAFRSTRDWYREYTYLSRVLVIDRWNLSDGADTVTSGVKKKLETLLKNRTDNGFVTILLSRLLWANAYEQFSPVYQQELPDMYIRPLPYTYRKYESDFGHHEEDF